MISPYYLKTKYKKYYIRGIIPNSYWYSESAGCMSMKSWYETKSNVDSCTQYRTSSDDIY